MYHWLARWDGIGYSHPFACGLWPTHPVPWHFRRETLWLSGKTEDVKIVSFGEMISQPFDSSDAVGFNSLTNQIVPHSFGTLLGQIFIEVFRTTMIGIAINPFVYGLLLIRIWFHSNKCFVHSFWFNFRRLLHKCRHLILHNLLIIAIMLHSVWLCLWGLSSVFAFVSVDRIDHSVHCCS